LTFCRSLASIELHFDDYQLLNLSRQTSPRSPLSLDDLALNLTSPKGYMTLESATLQLIHIKASYMRATQDLPSGPFSFQPRGSLSARNDATAFIRIANAKVGVSICQKLAASFERSTKKQPPCETSISLLCISKAELDASTLSDPIFADLIPKVQGRVYIGFPTHQTTGFAGHVSGPSLVPTVERESIDLADPQMKIWNRELLNCVGIFAR
jgi:hypothetical protein